MPRSCYSSRELETWAERLEAGWGRAATGFVYFNNDGNGCALRDASVYARALDRRGVELASLPVVSDDVLLDPGLFVADVEGRAPVAAGRSWKPARAAPRRSSSPSRRAVSTRCPPR
jgi:hypothetical protein